MRILDKIIVFLLVLLLSLSGNTETVSAASVAPEQEIESTGEGIAETELTEQVPDIEKDKAADQEEIVEETEPIDSSTTVPEQQQEENAESPKEETVLESELQQETEALQEEMTETETETFENEIKGYAGMSLASKASGKRLLRKAAGNSAGTAYVRNSSYSQVKTIDISEFNIVTDWAKVKASGVDAVIIRVAGRYIGSGNLFDDDNFGDNVQGAAKAGLRVGVYFFSQALNEKEAIEEADYAAQKMAPYKSSITLPVFMDYEWDDSSYRLYNGGSIAQRTATVKAFMTEIKKKGYSAGLYASDNVLGNYLDSGSIALIASIWIAHWGVSAPGSSYSGVYDCWQYTSSGTVPGVDGLVDLDYYYIPVSAVPAEPVPGTSENVTGKEGIYIISSVSNPGHALQVGNDGNLTLENYTGNNNQRFIITSGSDGRYQITSYLNGKVFDCQSGGKITGTNVRTYTKNGTIAQTWLLQKADSQTFYITAYNSGNKITAGSNMNIQLGSQDNSKEYEFILNKVSTDTIAEGWYEIPCASASGYVLDIKGASYADKANCHIYKNNGTNAQKFYIEKTTDGYYRVMCAASGKALDVSGASMADYANIQQYSVNGTDAQKWTILANDDGTYSFFSKKSIKSLSVANSQFANTSNVYQVPYTGETGQKFKLTKKTTASGAAVSEGKYYIVSAGNTGYAVEVEDGKLTNAANVRLNTKKTSSAQQFIFSYLGNGYYTILNDNSGRALDVKGGSKANKANIQQYQANGTGAQIWKVQKNSDGTFTLINQKSSKCLDVASAKYQDNTNIWQYQPNGTNAQKFYLSQK